MGRSTAHDGLDARDEGQETRTMAGNYIIYTLPYSEDMRRARTG
ncbi:hypothetical protein [Rhodovulum marinum]|nr:hypothetical protein [Rhodovulum marinum]